MAVLNFKQVSTNDNILDKIQQNVGEVVKILGNEEILGGRLVSDVALTTSAALISHGLGRPAKGYIVTKADTAAHVYDDEASNVLKIQFLKLVSSASVTVSLWVF